MRRREEIGRHRDRDDGDKEDWAANVGGEQNRENEKRAHLHGQRPERVVAEVLLGEERLGDDRAQRRERRRMAESRQTVARRSVRKQYRHGQDGVIRRNDAGETPQRVETNVE